MRWIKSVLLSLFALSVAAPVLAQVSQGDVTYRWGYSPIVFRNTSAASVARDANWARGTPGTSPTGFVDSTVFRATGVGPVDTTCAYRTGGYPFPFDAGRKGATALVDTSTSAWIGIRVLQDSTSYSWSGVVGVDSIQVAAQVSYDGVTWYNVTGTPTRAYDATAPIPVSSEGTTPIALLAAEPSVGAEFATVYLGCDPHTSLLGGAYIINRTLCMADMLVRFLIGPQGGGGQFRAEIGSWHKQDN